MNKELINKYKPEFDHWLNDGTVLMGKRNLFNNTIKWYPSITNPFIEISESIIIIIKDEYFTYRKALAEGKTIEYLGQSSNLWQELEDANFNLHPNCYRIKPDEPKFKIPAYFKELSSGIVVEFTEELSNNLDVFSNPERWEYLPNYKEPKFKVGDFVKVTPKSHRAITNSGPTEFIGIIKHINKYTLYNVKGINDTDWFEFDDIQLWTPIKDEWCWFYDNKDSKYSHLAQFYDMNISEDSSLSTFMSSPITKWYYCEPFLNSRPSYLRDK